MIDVTTTGAQRWRKLESGPILWGSVTAICLICLILAGYWPGAAAFPAKWGLPVAAWINAVTTPLFAFLQPAFRAFSALLDGPLHGLQAVLQWLPWPAFCGAIILVAGRAGGLKLAIFAAVTCLYILVTGYWQPSMNTLALILFAVPLSVVAGFILGVLSFRLPRWRPVIETCLDLMQTVPAFAYLIPLLLLFGFGPVVGLISSAVYAIPPMVRNTSLGLDLVAAEIREAGTMSGSNRRQLFWLVEIPCALPQLLVGINQTTMAAFSMVIIASIIGGFADIGWAVLDAMRKAEFGQSLLSGGVIALMAMVMDRITHGFSRKPAERPLSAASLAGRKYWLLLAAALALALLLRFGLGADSFWLRAPDAWVNADSLNGVILGLVTRYSDLLDAIKNAVFYALLLPLRLGLVGVATPYVWGITLTPLLAAIYWAGVAFLAWLGRRFASWRLAVAILLAGAILYSGFSSLPWPILPLLLVTLGARLGGRKLALLVAGSLAFMLLSGLWPPLMQSFYLCGLAILLSVLVGGSLGIWAAHSRRASVVLRAVCDALQTMPQFVFLIPVLMFFKVGEFTALIAIMLYAVVPPIRYGEHALRAVPTGLVEAGTQMGCTPRQMLWLVKMPAALPIIMLGVNQTIMAALSMLVIAAMVGTRDLGQQVYIALGKADAGLGLVSGLAIALLAIMTDRLIKAWEKTQATTAAVRAES
jgi:glycine betaine/proline transport system permease protein